jgi:hypothetical protein
VQCQDCSPRPIDQMALDCSDCRKTGDNFMTALPGLNATQITEAWGSLSDV